MSPLGIRRPPPERPLRVRAPRALLDVLRAGPAPLLAGADPDVDRLAIVLVLAPAGRDGGARRHAAALAPELAARGHDVHLLAADDDEPAAHAGVAVHRDAGAVPDVDVAVAVGAEAVAATLALPRVRARAVLQADDERLRHPASAAQLWARWADEQRLFRIVATPWLADAVAADGGVAEYAPGIDQDTFRPLPLHRRDDAVVAYAPASAPWRAAPIVVLALEELARRRPELDLAVFGSARPIESDAPRHQLGVLDPDTLAQTFAAATVGIVLSLTAPSLVGVEMLACGLSVVEADGPGPAATYGAGGLVELRAPDPLSVADGVGRLLDDLELRAARARDGLALASGRTWAAAATQVETALRAALAGMA